MLDNALNILIRSIIVTGLSDYGYSGIAVQQANQPTQQGANTQSTIYFTKISDHRYGFLQREDVWNDLTSEMDHTESQQYESTFQINALSIQNPADITSLTASDLVNIVAAILQSDKTVNALINAGVGILRITEVRNPYFADDANRFEASPSFDFTLTHRQSRVSVNPKVDTINSGIFPI